MTDELARGIRHSRLRVRFRGHDLGHTMRQRDYRCALVMIAVSSGTVTAACLALLAVAFSG